MILQVSSTAAVEKPSTNTPTKNNMRLRKHCRRERGSVTRLITETERQASETTARQQDFAMTHTPDLSLQQETSGKITETKQ